MSNISGLSWCYGNYFWFAFVLVCGYSSVYFQSFVLHHLAPVVQTLDSAIHRINHSPVDKYLGKQLHYPLDRFLSGG